MTTCWCARLPPAARQLVAIPLADGSAPEAELRRSKRATRLSLRLLCDGSLRLTAPQAMSLRDIELAAHHFAPWLEKRLAQHAASVEERVLPTSLVLPFTGAEYAITHGGEYAAGRSLASRARSVVRTSGAQGGQRLLLLELDSELRCFCTDGVWQGASAPVEQHPLLQLLVAFCRRQATALLPPFLNNVAARHGFIVNDIRIHDQHSRWASCARMRTGAGHRINLNWRGVFLTQELFTHLCCHELCHTLHMDHSARFHAALEKISPNAKALERGLNAAWRNLPWWVKLRFPAAN